MVHTFPWCCRVYSWSRFPDGTADHLELNGSWQAPSSDGSILSGALSGTHPGLAGRSLFPSFLYWQFCVNLKNGNFMDFLIICLQAQHFWAFSWLGLKASLLLKGLQGFIIPELGTACSLSRAESIMLNSFSLHLKGWLCLPGGGT